MRECTLLYSIYAYAGQKCSVFHACAVNWQLLRSPDAAKPAGAVPRGKGGGQPQLHHGRIPRLLAPLLRLDAARPPSGKDDLRNIGNKRGIKKLKSCTP